MDKWRELYDWLGSEIRIAQQESEENELCINLDESAGPQYRAEAMQETRKHMRRLDTSLPLEDIDDW